jgi:hypothetical protein
MQKLPQRNVGLPHTRADVFGRAVWEAKLWQGVRSSVGVLAWCVGAEGAMGLLLGASIAILDPFHGSSASEALLGCLIFGMGLMGVGCLIALVLSLLAPAHSGLRLHRIGTYVTGLMGPVVFVSPILLDALTRNAALRQFEWLLWLMLLTGVVLVVAAWVWYCIYLRGVARYFGNQVLAVNFLALGIVSAVMAVSGIGGTFAAQFFGFVQGDVEELAVIGGWLGGLVLLVWLDVLLFGLYRLIPSADLAIPSRKLT